MGRLLIVAGWNDSLAGALDDQAAVLNDALDELLVVEAVLEQRGSTQLATELRSFAGGLRAEARTIESDARALRQQPDVDHRTLPMVLTTRHVQARR